MFVGVKPLCLVEQCFGGLQAFGDLAKHVTPFECTQRNVKRAVVLMHYLLLWYFRQILR